MKRRVHLRALVAALAVASSAGALAQNTQAERAWLQEHNAARSDFGSPPLRWSARLAREAQTWAESLAVRNTLIHSRLQERGEAGENLWMGSRGYFTPSRMIASFVDERADFVPGRFPQVSRTGRWSDVGHYTQIVWPQTREVGCAMASGPQFDTLVCRYWPAGNRIGETIRPASKFSRR